MVKIRDYKHQDLEATTKLMKILSEIMQIKFDEENWKQMARCRTFNPQFRTLIADHHEDVVGMCFVDIERDETGLFHGIIRNVVVNPSFRKRGIATQLITTAMDILTNMKVDNIRVQISEQVKDTISLFQNFSFKCSSIIMEKDVVKVREYKESDYEVTKDLMQIYSKLIHQSFDEDEWKQTIKIRIRNPQYRILISEYEGIVTGMAFIDISSDETGLTIGYIKNAIVHPKYRSQGFGKDLLIRAVEILNVLNVDKIRIMAHLETKNYLKYFEDLEFYKAGYMLEFKPPDT